MMLLPFDTKSTNCLSLPDLREESGCRKFGLKGGPSSGNIGGIVGIRHPTLSHVSSALARAFEARSGTSRFRAGAWTTTESEGYDGRHSRCQDREHAPRVNDFPRCARRARGYVRDRILRTPGTGCRCLGRKCQQNDHPRDEEGGRRRVREDRPHTDATSRDSYQHSFAGQTGRRKEARRTGPVAP